MMDIKKTIQYLDEINELADEKRTIAYTVLAIREAIDHLKPGETDGVPTYTVEPTIDGYDVGFPIPIPPEILIECMERHYDKLFKQLRAVEVSSKICEGILKTT